MKLEEVLQYTLSASVGHGDAFAAFGMPDLTDCSKGTVLFRLYPVHCSCCEVKTASLSAFELRACPFTPFPLLILIFILRGIFGNALLIIALLIVMVSICTRLRNVGSRVPVAYRLGIVLIGSVSQSLLQVPLPF